MTKAQILKIVKDNDVKFIDFQFTDLHGMLKTVTKPIEQLDDCLDHGIWFDGSSVEGFTRIFESDMYLKPDLITFAVISWTKNTSNVQARFICDVYTPEGKPYETDPRYILRKEMERATKMGYTYYVGPELEFFLFEKDENGFPIEPSDSVGYFDQDMESGAEVRADISKALKEFGMHIEALHHEVAPGQHEINFKYENALVAADNSITLKQTVKSIASQYGLHATFMAKPVFGENGNGMHVNQSLFKDGENVFYNSKGIYGLSDIAQQYIAGLMKHVKAMNAIINPTVNSYKRLVVGYEAPVYIAWGQKNRSALIRVPRILKGQEKGTRVELRCPDPTANPYLAFAVMLRAGLDGIENKMKAPKPVEENIFEYGEEEAREKSVDTLSPNLRVALMELRDNPVMRDVLGESTFQKYYNGKKQEWNDYRIQVTDWELKKYINY